MFYNPFKSYSLSTHMTEELKRSFKKTECLFEDPNFDSTDIQPYVIKYREYFRSYVPDALCCDFIDEIYALKDMFHHLVVRDYEEVYQKDGYKFEDGSDISEIYSTVSRDYYNPFCQYIFYYHEIDDVDNADKLHEIYLYESKGGEKEIGITYYSGKHYIIKFASGAQLKKSDYKKLDISYYYRSLPIYVSVSTIKGETYSFNNSDIYNVRQMANTILQDSKALYYLVKFYSKTLGEEYVNRSLKFK